MRRLLAAALWLLVGRASGLENGLARTPPMGWRSWYFNQYDMDQSVWMATVDALVDTSRLVGGKNTSLRDVGYEWVGQDDGWQQCAKPPPRCTVPRGGTQKCGPHRGSGGWHNASGSPQLDKVKYPDLKAAVAYAHKHGLKADWCE